MSHWSDKKEQVGSVWQMSLLFFIYKKINKNIFRGILHVVTLFFYIFSPSTRSVSKKFLIKVGSKGVYKHMYSFSNLLLEKLSSWAGNSNYSDLIVATKDISIITEQLAQGKGAVIICSHLGNIEMLRAIARLDNGKNLPPFGIHTIIDNNISSKFSKMIESVNPEYNVQLINASTIDASTIIYLQEAVTNGDLVVIAGDRTAKNNKNRNFEIEFLGEKAYFPQGAFILANLLESPIYYMFALRQDDEDFNSPYEFHVYKSKYNIVCTRKDRKEKNYNIVNEYVKYLEALCREHPYQWFNFFDFWKNPAE